MNTYQSFIFDSYEFDESAGRIELRYALDSDVSFIETIELPLNKEMQIKDPAALERALFMLHLIGGMSYYKTCLPKTIEVNSGKLTAEQAAFWNDVYENGLGEFFYKNKIDFRGLINFPCHAEDARSIDTKSEAPLERLLDTARSDIPRGDTHMLVPIGGGKDSLVTIELLKKAGVAQTLLRVGSHPFIDDMAALTGQPLLTIGRNLAPELFDLNAAGALNGHVPITAYLSILSIVLAEIYGYSHVAFSNERSANEGNTEMFGKEINHQWSKGFAFESALQNYLTQYVSKNVTYFSMLRPLSELQIVQMFSEYPQYHGVFTSCNTNWRILKERPKDRWCGACPKCAFAFAMLSAFLPKDAVLTIFEGKNLFEEESLVPLFRELLGLTDVKPFECVGTPQETYAALCLADELGSWEGTPVMTMFQKEELNMPFEPQVVINDALKPSTEHAIPAQFRSLLPL